jgi:hypothetical protein
MVPDRQRRRHQLPVNRLVAYVLEREGGNWLGQSLLRSAYKNWLLKDRALRTWSTSIDRNGIGIPIYTGAENETNLEPGQAIAEDMRSRRQRRRRDPPRSQDRPVGVTGQLPDIDKFVRYQDEQIARAVLAHFLNLGTQTGSRWATSARPSPTSSPSPCRPWPSWSDHRDQHIVEDLVDLNFGIDRAGARRSSSTRSAPGQRARPGPRGRGTRSDADLVKLLRTIPTPQEAMA